jgi:hypothetical protein
MDKLIAKIAKEFIRPIEHYDNVLDDILKLILREPKNYFDVGYIIYINESSEIIDGEYQDRIIAQCKDIYFSNSNIVHDKKHIDSFKTNINKSLLELKPIEQDKDYPHQCGLCFFAANEFLKGGDGINNAYICIDNLDLIEEDRKEESIDSKLSFCYKKVNYNVLEIKKDAKSEFIFPVFLKYYKKGKNAKIFYENRTLYAIIVLDAFSSRNYKKNQIKELSYIISNILTRNIDVKADKEFNYLINKLSEYDPDTKATKKLTDEDDRIVNALTDFYNYKNIRKDIFIHRNLKHISIWSYNDCINYSVLEESKPKLRYKKYLVKNKATKPERVLSTTDEKYEDTRIIINKEDVPPHYYYTAITKFLNLITSKDKRIDSFEDLVIVKRVKKYYHLYINLGFSKKRTIFRMMI